MKIKLGELKLDDVISLLCQNKLKLVIVENKNELMVNQINPNFEIEINEGPGQTEEREVPANEENNNN